MVMNPPFGSRLKGSWGDYKGGYKGLLLVYSRLARRVTLRLLFGLGYYKGYDKVCHQTFPEAEARNSTSRLSGLKGLFLGSGIRGLSRRVRELVICCFCP